MENVKGMLSAHHLDTPIFPEVMHSLANAGGENQYRLFPLCPSNGHRSWDEGLSPRDFLVRTEQHGIPQRRHRVFVICVRQDVAASLPQHLLPRLEPSEETVSVNDIIGSMPKLRSRLSAEDADASWKATVADAYDLIRTNRPTMTNDQEALFLQALDDALEISQGTLPPSSNANGGTGLGRFVSGYHARGGFQTRISGDFLTTKQEAIFERISPAISLLRHSHQPPEDLPRRQTSLRLLPRGMQVGTPENLMIAFECNWVINHQRPLQAISPETVTTSFIPIPNSAGVSQFEKRPAFRPFRTTITFTGLELSSTCRWATPCHLISPY